MKYTDPVASLPYIGDAYEQKLKKLGIYTIEDLLHHIPNKFLDYTNVTSIKNLKVGIDSSITAEIVNITQVRTRNGKLMILAQVQDDTDKLEIIWINQPFLIRMLKKGMYVQFFGKLSFWGKKKVFSFPKFEIIGTKGVNKGKLMPIYPETEGLTSTWLQKRSQDALKTLDEIEDFLDIKDIKKHNLIDLKESLINIHLPHEIQDWERGVKRLAFNELLLLQLQKALERIEWQSENKALDFKVDKKHIKIFEEALPFNFTESQQKAISQIFEDFNKQHPMNRLLQGDVGSGKTVVAAFASFASFVSGYQSVIMAPTQVLAQQHYKTLKEMLKNFEMRVSLVTGSESVSNWGRSDLIVGTHALLHRPNLFENTAVVVIDEQHRFGVRQRAKILENTKSKTHTPHILSMTATPIPRTITLTMYGELDISFLDKPPSGRKAIKTWVVSEKKRKSAYNWIEEQITNLGVQAFVVCPFIDESEDETLSQVKAAKAEYEKIKNILPNLKIGLLHGKMKGVEKNQVLNDFKNKKYDILVTTPVIEVGIDIANATIMVIEAAERFGLAQLHQLRGRVGRSSMQSYCLLFTESKSRPAIKRLKLMEEHSSGQKLAELDLELRGPGEIFGVRQSGLPELKIANWNDIDLIKQTKDFALNIATNQNKFPKVLSYYKRKIISNN